MVRAAARHLGRLLAADPDPSARPEARQAVDALVAVPEIDRVLLDLRQNPGGDNTNNGATVATLQRFVSTRAGARWCCSPTG